jgi:hypothetical protein
MVRSTATLSQMSITADAPKSERPIELSDDDLELVQVSLACIVPPALLLALTFWQRLAIMILRNEVNSSSELRHVNISPRQFAEVQQSAYFYKLLTTCIFIVV